MSSKFLTKSGSPKYRALYKNEVEENAKLQKKLSTEIDRWEQISDALDRDNKTLTIHRDRLIEAEKISLGVIGAESSRADKAERKYRNLSGAAWASIVLNIIFIIKEIF